MNMYSDCSGDCEDCVTFYTGGCLAGHGDDDFMLITVEHAKEILANPHIEQRRKTKIQEKFPELAKKGNAE
jgi:hypothetical protein